MWFILLPKLCKYSFDFSSVCRNCPKASPVVGLHRQVPQCQHAENGAAAVADDHVQDPVIPPTLGKVWQLVLERIFQKLEHDRDDGGEPPVSKNEGLAPVAEGVCEDEDVELFVDVVERIVRPLPIVDPAVSAVIFLRYRFTEAVVQVLEKLSERAKINLPFWFRYFKEQN